MAEKIVQFFFDPNVISKVNERQNKVICTYSTPRLRYRCIISDDIKLHRRFQDLKDCYPPSLVIQEVAGRCHNLNYTNRDKKPSNWVLWIKTLGQLLIL